MKVILNYGNYLCYGKQYQAKFVYESIDEATQICLWITSNQNKLLIDPVQKLTYLPKSKYNNTSLQSSVITKTNIPKDILLQFINELINTYKATVIIGDKEFTNMEQANIAQAINKLHININLKKGKYFGFKDTYYAIFKYNTNDQKEEVSYDFNVNLSSLIGTNPENECYIFPFIIDKNGNITTENTGIIGGTNIPTQTLSFFLQRFIKEYNAIINIDDSLQKDEEEIKIIHEVLSRNNQQTSKLTRKKDVK